MPTSKLAYTIVTAVASSVVTLIFQHFMVIKPLMDMLDACQGKV